MHGWGHLPRSTRCTEGGGRIPEGVAGMILLALPPERQAARVRWRMRRNLPQAGSRQGQRSPFHSDRTRSSRHSSPNSHRRSALPDGSLRQRLRSRGVGTYCGRRRRYCRSGCLRRTARRYRLLRRHSEAACSSFGTCSLRNQSFRCRYRTALPYSRCRYRIPCSRESRSGREHCTRHYSACFHRHTARAYP